MEGGRPASSGSGGTAGLVAWLGGGGISNIETVTHCSLTPLVWVAKIVKSWTFINLPRRADWLEPGPVFFPPSSPSRRVNGIQCNCAEAAALRRQTWVSANNQASDAWPRYWLGGRGTRSRVWGIPEETRDKGSSNGPVCGRGKVRTGASMQNDINKTYSTHSIWINVVLHLCTHTCRLRLANTDGKLPSWINHKMVNDIMQGPNEHFWFVFCSSFILWQRHTHLIKCI